MRSASAALVVLSAMGASCPQPHPPAPSPTPTMPAPEPTTPPTPGPAPACAPGPGLDPCRPAEIGVDGRYRAAVDRAIEVVVRAEHPAWFGPEVRPNSWLILGPAGETLPPDAIPGHFHQAVIVRLQKVGFCARMESDEVAVSHPADFGYENYHTVIANAGPRTAYGRGMFRATCDTGTRPGPAPSAPPSSPTPAAAQCPADAPQVDRFRIDHRRLARLIVDVTPVGGPNEAWCQKNGFLDPDGSGQSWCPYGQETPAGDVQRRACETERGAPYVFRWNGLMCGLDGDCDFNAGNQLQIAIPDRNAVGTVEVCARTGVCKSQQIQ